MRSASAAVHCRDVRNRSQRINVSTVDEQLHLELVPAETARLTPIEAVWLAEALLQHAETVVG